MSNESRPVAPAGPPLNHELSDADPRPILKFLAFLVVLTIVVAVVVVVFYNYLEHREAAEKTARYPMSLADQERPLPPPPRLQTYPFEDIKDLRRSEDPLLTRYEWIDQGAGTVRIPIERAMELLAERGLPHRAEQPGEPAAGQAGSPGTAQDTGETGSPGAAPGGAGAGGAGGQDGAPAGQGTPH
jgi:hypothetical protein